MHRDQETLQIHKITRYEGKDWPYQSFFLVNREGVKSFAHALPPPMTTIPAF